MNLLETSYLVDYETGRASAEQYFQAHAHDPLGISTLSIFELGFGVVQSDTDSLDELVPSLHWAEFVEFSPADAIEGALIHSELRQEGESIPIGDTMIAGVARNRGATLVTRDDHFERIEGLAVDFFDR